jgi:hypothetical protein
MDRISLSDWRSVPFWMRRLRKFIKKDPAYPDLEGDLVPVALKIDVGGLNLGFQEKVLPHRVQAWNGERWIPVRWADTDAMQTLSESQGEGEDFGPLRPKKRATPNPMRVALRHLEAKGESPYLYPEAGKSARPGVKKDIEEFRKLPVEERAQKPLWSFLFGDGTPTFKMTKLEASYTGESPYEGNCGNCVHAYQHVTTGTYICDWMRGAIAPTGWCRVWGAPISAKEYKDYQERGNVSAKVARVTRELTLEDLYFRALPRSES